MTDEIAVYNVLLDDLRHETPDGGEYWSARELAQKIKYADWRNFDRLIQRALQLIRNGLSSGIITSETATAEIGFGAQRHIPDYHLDRTGAELVEAWS